VEKLEEMNKFLDAYDLPKLNQENITYMNRLIKSQETEAVIIFQQRKSQTDSLLNSTKPLKKLTHQSSSTIP
jgi:hypothetical protein